MIKRKPLAEAKIADRIIKDGNIYVNWINDRNISWKLGFGIYNLELNYCKSPGN